MTGSPRSQATPGSPVTSSVSSTTTAAAAATAATTPLTASQHNKGIVHKMCVCVCARARARICVYIL